MDGIQNTTVYVDFELDGRDLFRVSLVQAKWRLLIGVLISLFFSGGMVYIFLLIDEKDILVQTALLFIGFPLLGVGGQVLRLHATCRKVLAAVPQSQRRMQYMFSTHSDGFDLVRGESFSHIAWSDMSTVREFPQYFLFYRSRYEACAIPKRGFHQPSDIPRFREILFSHLGNKAQLMR